MKHVQRRALVSIDPGINALGWALWRFQLGKKKLEAPLSAGVVQCPIKRSMHWDKKVVALIEKFEREIDARCDGHRVITTVACEWAEFRAGDAVGHAAASRDNLGALCFAAGMHARWAEQIGAKFRLWPVSLWKGNLPKAAMNKRVARAIGSRDKNGDPFESHAWDAVGLGLVHKGFDLNDANIFGAK